MQLLTIALFVLYHHTACLTFGPLMAPLCVSRDLKICSLSSQTVHGDLEGAENRPANAASSFVDYRSMEDSSAKIRPEEIPLSHMGASERSHKDSEASISTSYQYQREPSAHHSHINALSHSNGEPLMEIEWDPLIQHDEFQESGRKEKTPADLHMPERSIRKGLLPSTKFSKILDIFNHFTHENGGLHFSTVARHLHILFGSKISVLLPAVIVSIVAEFYKAPQVYIFVSSLVGIAPLAERLGFVTEQLAFYTGPTVGGLLNATLGNATEMILSLFALHSGLIRVVQLSLLGSILSNMLLVLGCASFFGGLAHPHHDQQFNQAVAVMNSGLLLMTVMGLLFPAVLHSTHTELNDGVSELYLSRFTSCVMLVAYASFLYFQLKSERQRPDASNNEKQESEEQAEEEEQILLGPMSAFVWLGVLTFFISLLSSNLVNAIEGASKTWNIPIAFVSVIILPIVGNAAEHASAILFAVKNKLDLSVAVAIGSSTQISMFVIPFCVVYGWVSGNSMDLNFHIFETSTLFITVIVVAFMLQEGRSNYFKGLMLIFCYLIVAASFFVHADVLD